MSTFIKVALSAAIVLSFISAASARKSGVTQRDRELHACYHDAMKLCKEFVPDEKKTTACMMAKRQHLSPICASMIKGHKS